ncbi:hypothetical protein ACHAXT_007650 [Thalassiosira profunda]
MPGDSGANRDEPMPASAPPLSHAARVSLVRAHFARKGYCVHSGLQFGVALVLYADDPSKVHSDFCVHVPEDGGRLDWRTLQTLARSMPDWHKALIVAHVRAVQYDGGKSSGDGGEEEGARYEVDELAIATEHAPFRHKNLPRGVGSQVKPPPRA